MGDRPEAAGTPLTLNLPDLPAITVPAGSHLGNAGGWEEGYYEPDDWMLDEAAAYESQIIEEGIREQVESRAKRYLSETGDAVRDRVHRSLIEATTLLASHPGAAIVSAMTAAEITIRFLILRPMLAGLVIEPTLADDLAELAFSGRTERDHGMLPRLCAAWQLELGEVKTADGTPAWPAFQRLKEPRNLFVHRAEPVEPATAAEAIAVARALLDGLVEPLANRLHLFGGYWGDDAETRDPLALKVIRTVQASDPMAGMPPVGPGEAE
jgi:hypothetical protein